MGKPHKHAEVIKAWADGGQLEFKNSNETDDEWRPVMLRHCWRDETEYRIKPEPVYPVTRMSDHELSSAYHGIYRGGYGNGVGFQALANIAIRRAIEDGDVILPNKD